MINKAKELYKKYQEIINYLIVGGLTTVVSFVTFWVFNDFIKFDYRIANVISWVCAVAFAYITNKVFVFHKKRNNKKEVLKEIVGFTGSRVVTLLLDMGIMIFLVEVFHINELIVKLICQVVVTIANYVLSKLFVFKK